MAHSVAASLKHIHSRIAASRAASLLAREGVELVAVSKGQPEERIAQALAAGQRVFGENRVQEAAAKWPALRARYPDIRLHLIGHLQSNKAKEAVAQFDVIETLDRPSLGEALAREMRAAGRNIPCFIQVNTGEEPQKSGISPVELGDFLRRCRQEWQLDIAGLMCIPPHDAPPAQHFGLLYELARRHGLAQLSMGMSGDFETAIRFGASHVRIGTAIFGERD